MSPAPQVLPSGSMSSCFTNLPPMWLAERWVFPRGEIPGVAGRLPEGVIFDWTGVHPSLAAQLRWAICTPCLSGEWRAQNLIAARTNMRHLMRFLHEDASDLTSLLDRDLETWQMQLRSHLVARSTYRPRAMTFLVRSAPGGAREYIK